jgi:hypothetical protein
LYQPRRLNVNLNHFDTSKFDKSFSTAGQGGQDHGYTNKNTNSTSHNGGGAGDGTLQQEVSVMADLEERARLARDQMRALVDSW